MLSGLRRSRGVRWWQFEGSRVRQQGEEIFIFFLQSLEKSGEGVAKMGNSITSAAAQRWARLTRVDGDRAIGNEWEQKMSIVIVLSGDVNYDHLQLEIDFSYIDWMNIQCPFNSRNVSLGKKNKNLTFQEGNKSQI